MLCQIPAPVNTSDSVKVSGALTDQAYAVIRERILSGIYSFGTVISRRELAAELGMSQVPVNEALARLEDDYLIENTARGADAGAGSHASRHPWFLGRS